MSTERKVEIINLGVEGLSYIKGSNTLLLGGQRFTLGLLRVFMPEEIKGVPIEELSKPEHVQALEDAILEITVFGGAPNIDRTDLAE